VLVTVEYVLPPNITTCPLPVSGAMAWTWRMGGVVAVLSCAHAWMHAPEMQEPVVQGGRVPHRQPEAEHVSATRLLQRVHAEPLRPHSVTVVPARQKPPSQQPEHVAASHAQTPLRHAVPVGQSAPVDPQEQLPLAPHVSARAASQVAQVAPPVPQLCAVAGEWHTFPVQQPAQAVASQEHTPL
jgi:hypothetical protein